MSYFASCCTSLRQSLPSLPTYESLHARRYALLGGAASLVGSVPMGLLTSAKVRELTAGIQISNLPLSVGAGITIGRAISQGRASRNHLLFIVPLIACYSFIETMVVLMAEGKGSSNIYSSLIANATMTTAGMVFATIATAGLKSKEAPAEHQIIVQQLNEPDPVTDEPPAVSMSDLGPVDPNIGNISQLQEI